VDPPARTERDWLLLLVPSFIWGTTWFAIKFQLGTVAPEASVAYRFLLASLLVFAWCALRGIPLRFGARTHAGLLLLGLLQYALNYVLVYRAEAHLASGLVALIFGMLVLWNLLGGRLLLGTPLRAPVVAGALTGLVGVTLVLWPELAHLHGGPSQATGVVLAVLATAVASGGNLLSQRIFQRGVPVVSSTAWSMLYGALAVAASCAGRGVPFTFDLGAPYLLSLGYLALFGSALAFLSYLTLLRRVGAGRAGYTAVIIPVVAMGTSTVFEHYRWTGVGLLGMALVLAGNVLILRPAR
jgi:drug/metabolite transporter (DMT)-like permease